MLFPDRIPETEAMPSGSNASLYNDYLRARRGYKEDFCNLVVSKCARGNVLEVTSGWGYTGIDITKRSGQISLHILADNDEIARLAENNAHEEEIFSHVEITQGSKYSIPYPDNYFDAVVSTNVLHTWQSPERIIREMYRVARAGGHLFINDLRRDAEETIAEYMIREMKEDKTHFGQYSLSKFIQSWRAAYTIDEIRAMIENVGITWVEIEEDGAMTCTVIITKETRGGSGSLS